MVRIVFTLIGFIFLCLISCSTEQVRIKDFNFDWNFSLAADSNAFLPEYDDSQWQNINLPHDWSVSFPFDTTNGEGCVGYLPGGIGWYRKDFVLDDVYDKNTFILFDGIYNNSDVRINGQKLGFHPYGYTPFYYDLTPCLNGAGEKNTLVVKVDRSRFADSRWYPGSGIYRNVRLITTNKLHIPIWGTYVTTPVVNNDSAQVNVKIRIRNDHKIRKKFVVKSRLVNQEGEKIVYASNKISLSDFSDTTLNQNLMVENPLLWSTATPNLYTISTDITVGKKVVDSYLTKIGIRAIRFDADSGFYLNNNNLKIKGVCLHHDGGLVGAAVPKSVWKRRLRILKEGGCNAIRVSHNPASDEFLDLCDEMGFLVQEEFFDEWDYPKDKRLNMHERHDDFITRGYNAYFQEWAEKDLKTTVLARRNHPCIIQWSLGNEIEWTYPRNRPATGFFDNASWEGNYFWSQPPYSPTKIKATYNSLPARQYQIENTALKLAGWTKELDTTRPVIANCILPSASFQTGYSNALDIVGFSYRRVMYDYAHEHYPEKIVMGTENLCQWHEWKAIEERSFISGTFLWTGIDYMGEAHHDENSQGAGMPRRRGTTSGLIDFAGFEKPSYFMMKSLWADTATLYLSTQIIEKSIYKVDKQSGDVIEKKDGNWKTALWTWHDVNNHWNYSQGDTVIVEVISNAQIVELFLNGRSLGDKNLSEFEDRIYKWTVPFTEGKLEAKGVYKSTDIATFIRTSSEPARIELTVDKKELFSDGYDIAHVVAQLYDKYNNPVRVENRNLKFAVNGELRILGVDNGSGYSLQTYASDTIFTNNGRALLIVQSLRKEGRSTIMASSNGLTSNVIQLKSQKKVE